MCNSMGSLPDLSRLSIGADADASEPGRLDELEEIERLLFSVSVTLSNGDSIDISTDPMRWTALGGAQAERFFEAVDVRADERHPLRLREGLPLYRARLKTDGTRFLILPLEICFFDVANTAGGLTNRDEWLVV